ncbi:hypothetical protein CVT24_010501 [Panaeolus cyanescens]|uniref:F-box domain-containing protein n=1 Tax=Panaeolus cyanescens TaxID=181874 RepID=A0A409YLV6_9AGAR|nr:hypothetical protein CVT24_010501 [Panaeolus cyanescens]
MDSIETEFTPLHPAYRRISWPSSLENVPITLPEAFLPLLGHNVAPSGQAASVVKTYRDSLRAKEQEAQKKIMALQHELDIIQSEQRRLAKKALACDIILSVYRRLPNDIIYQIFTHCPSYLPPAQVQHMPTTFSHVSKAFRETIHGMSSQWQDLRVRESYYARFGPLSRGEAFDSRLKDLLNHFDRLSGPFPLKLTLGQRTLQEFEKCLHRHHDHRSTALEILSPPSSNPAVERLLQLVRIASEGGGGPQPNIQSLVIHRPPRRCITSEFMGGAQYTNDLVTSLLDHLPSLHHLWLGFDFACLREILRTASSIPAAINPWYRLTRLFMAHWITIDNNMCLATWLSLFPQLEIGSFTIVDQLVNPTAAITVHPPRAHRHLKELAITFASNVNLVTAFRNCSFPSLRSLWLEYENSSNSGTLFSTPSAMGLSVFPVLESLSIRNCAWPNDGDSMSRLLMLPTITNLNVFFPHSFRHVLGFLSLMQKRTTAGLNTPNTEFLVFPNISSLNLHVVESSEPCPWGFDLYYSDRSRHAMKSLMGTALCHAFPAISAARNQTQIKVEYVSWPDADDLQPTERENKENSYALLSSIRAHTGTENEGRDLIVQIQETMTPTSIKPNPLQEHFINYFH